MSSLDPKDRVSLCLFTFADGRRCRTPRAPANPHFCFYHAQKAARAAAADLLATDLSYFFSGDYLSACDLSSALARIIPAVVQGHVKPRVARTVSCLFQTLVQAVRLSQHEYINSFGTDGWRQAVRGSVDANSSYLSASDSSQSTSQPSAHASAGLPARTVCSERSNSERCRTERAGASRPAPSKPDPHHASTSRSTSSPPPNPSPAHPDMHPARADAALAIARSLFPPHSASGTSAPSRPAEISTPSTCVPAPPATPPASPQPSKQPRVAPAIPAPPVLPAASAVEGSVVEDTVAKLSNVQRSAVQASPSPSSPSPSPSAQSPTPTAPPPTPRRFGPPGFEGNTDPYSMRIDASLVRIDGKRI